VLGTVRGWAGKPRACVLILSGLPGARASPRAGWRHHATDKNATTPQGRLEQRPLEDVALGVRPTEALSLVALAVR
jgi:hypothetical protein